MGCVSKLNSLKEVFTSRGQQAADGQLSRFLFWSIKFSLISSYTH